VKYLILGGHGQLGRALSARLGAEAVALGRAQADLTRAETVQSALEMYDPEVVLNCAAYNFVDRAEGEAEAAFAVNEVGVGRLAALCRERRAILVHYSTDYVFGQEASRNTPYRETDTPGPVNVYGASKLAGENLVRAECPAHFILRTCGLYGEGESNFIKTMLRLAREGKRIRVVGDQVCTPTAAADLAEATAAIVATGAFGLYHVTNRGACSWHEFACAIFEEMRLAVPVTPISSAAYGAAARRPAYSVLAPAGWDKLGLPPLRAWRQALAEYVGACVSPLPTAGERET
jgi:dTDP-4-dehydrorhamnose reductase